MRLISSTILLLCTVTTQPSHAACLYNRQEYQLYETVTEMDSRYTKEMEAQGYSADPYAFVIECRPEVNREEIQKGHFSVRKFSVVNAVWVPSFIAMEEATVLF